MNKSITCAHYRVVSGCNIIDHACKCDQASLCDGDLEIESASADGTPFSFVNRLECEMNLKLLLTHELQDDKPGMDFGSLYFVEILYFS